MSSAPASHCALLLTMLMTNATQGQIVFSEVFQGPYIDNANGVAPTTENGNIICGSTFDATSQYDAFMVKLDAVGTEEWNLTIGIGGASELLNDVIQTQAGDFVAVGTTTSFSTFATREMWVVRVSATGTLSWSTRYPNNSGTDEDAWRLAELPTGELLVISNYPFHSRITKLSALGAVIWSKHYSTSPLEAVGFSDMDLLSNGNYVVAGIATGTGDWLGVDRGVLAEVDTAGTVQWWKEYGDLDFTQFMAVQQLRAGGSSEHPDLMVTGIRMPSATTYDDSLLVARMTSTGDLIWARIVPDARGLDLAVSPNGSSDVLVAGANYDAADSSLLVLGVDQFGTVQWGRSIGVPGTNYWEKANRICLNTDATYTTAGTLVTPGTGWGYHGAYVVRFNDPMGSGACWQPTTHALVPIALPVNLPTYNVSDLSASGIPAPMSTGMTLALDDINCLSVGVSDWNEGFELGAWPNVVCDELRLRHPALGRPSKVDVVDCAGRMVNLNSTVGHTETLVDITDLSGGLYTIALYWGRVQRIARFMVSR